MSQDATSPGSAPLFEASGPIGAPPIVFVHGTRLTRSMWRAQTEDLQDAFRVIAVDLPGHGAAAAETFTLRAAGDRVAEAIEAEGGRPAIVVGLSLGGYVAMDLASRRPELVRALVLAGATAEPVGARAAPYQALAWALGRFEGVRLQGLNARFFRARFPASVAEPIVAGGFWGRAGADALRSLVGERFAPRLAAYPGPTLILNGQFDLPFRLGARAFARAARDPRQVRLAGATHLTNLDRPRSFNAALRRFAEVVAARDAGDPGAIDGGRTPTT